MNEIYRRAASIVVLRPVPQEVGISSGSHYQLLLLKKPRKRDVWQLPQGGVEAGESIEQAALRELQEEAGMSGVAMLGASPDVYQYDFPSSFRRFRPDHIRGQRIEYILAIAPADAVVRVDGKEIDDYACVQPDQLHLYIRRKEYLDLARRLAAQAIALAPSLS